jgi:hypothetical protein
MPDSFSFNSCPVHPPRRPNRKRRQPKALGGKGNSIAAMIEQDPVDVQRQAQSKACPWTRAESKKQFDAVAI